MCDLNGKKIDDLISRQWLISCVNDGWIKFDTIRDENVFIHIVRDIAPSVEPKQKTGKWIIIQAFDDGCRYARCNQCNKTQVFYRNTERQYYCPNCGAEMKGEIDG